MYARDWRNTVDQYIPPESTYPIFSDMLPQLYEEEIAQKISKPFSCPATITPAIQPSCSRCEQSLISLTHSDCQNIAIAFLFIMLIFVCSFYSRAIHALQKQIRLTRGNPQ